MIHILSSSSELSWLTRHFKHYPIPDIIFDDSVDHMGLYSWPGDSPSSPAYDLPISAKGCIILGADFDSDTIAHEYRHHLQYWTKGSCWYTDLSTLYEPSFFYNDSEVDAVSFALVMSGSRSCGGWLADMGKIHNVSRQSLLDYIPIVEGAWWMGIKRRQSTK